MTAQSRRQLLKDFMLAQRAFEEADDHSLFSVGGGGASNELSSPFDYENPPEYDQLSSVDGIYSQATALDSTLTSRHSISDVIFSEAKNPLAERRLSAKIGGGVGAALLPPVPPTLQQQKKATTKTTPVAAAVVAASSVTSPPPSPRPQEVARRPPPADSVEMNGMNILISQIQFPVNAAECLTSIIHSNRLLLERVVDKARIEVRVL